ncbi:hypothetical protein [Flavobacterium tructae]|nr:hypothetical protein [Flavobacterium tructae]
MKRFNYYQVHKNKKPKRIKKPQHKVSHIPLIAIILANTAINVAIIQSSPFLDLVSKRIKILSNVIESAAAIIDVYDKIKDQNPRKLYYSYERELSSKLFKQVIEKS